MQHDLSLHLGNWDITFLDSASELALTHAASGIILKGKLLFESAAGWKVASSQESYRERLCLLAPDGFARSYIAIHADGDAVTLQAFRRAGRYRVEGRLSFQGTASMPGDAFACRTIPDNAERVLNLSDGTGDLPSNDSIFSPHEDLALQFHAPLHSITTLSSSAFSLALSCSLGDLHADAAMTFTVCPRYYASRWAPGYKPINRKRCPHAPMGWLSWNTYFDKAGAKENLAEARIAKKYLQPFGLNIWNIESWQGNSYWLPVAHFHNLDLSCLPEQFPEGMKKLADDLKALGYIPGLWMPLYGTGDDEFYRQHKDWFIHDENGKPVSGWNGKYMLDTTIPEVLQHIRAITSYAAHEWGYEYFKFDGMANKELMESEAVRKLVRHPEDKDWFVNSVKAMREGVGDDKIVLGSMSDFTGIEVGGQLDAARLGADIATCYNGIAEQEYLGVKSTAALMPIRWRNIMDQVECTYGEIFINNIMLYTDPDTLLVNYSLDTNEAQVMATVVALPGQVTFSGDKLGELRMDRMKILQQAFPVANIRPVSLYPYSALLPVWNLTVTRPFGTWHVAALFNFSDSSRFCSVTMQELGLDDNATFTAFEFWHQQWLGRLSHDISMDIPARSVRLIALWEDTAHPQFIGDDRHVTQGAVELNDLKWNEKDNVLTVNIKTVSEFPLTFAVAVPAPYQFLNASADVATQIGTQLDDNGLLRVTLTPVSYSNGTHDVPVKLAFA